MFDAWSASIDTHEIAECIYFVVVFDCMDNLKKLYMLMYLALPWVSIAASDTYCLTKLSSIPH